jgi:hypothetical protein
MISPVRLPNSFVEGSLPRGIDLNGTVRKFLSLGPIFEKVRGDIHCKIVRGKELRLQFYRTLGEFESILEVGAIPGDVAFVDESPRQFKIG